MTNFFNLNYTLPIGINNWFMPNWSFPDFSSMFQTSYFSIFDNWQNTFNSYMSLPISQPSLFQMDLNYFTNNSYTKPITTTTTTQTKTADKTEKTNTDTFVRSSGINYAKDNLKLDNYNAFKGERLANIALNRSIGWSGYCARYVKNDIQAAGLGSYKFGHAYQMPNILRNNPNFKEISPEEVDVSKLPAGCILVYDKGTQGYSKKYGHTEITTGDGRAVSDGITRHLYKKPSNIFIPV